MSMSDREFLARISARLGRRGPGAAAGGGAPGGAPARELLPPLEAVGPTDAEDLAARFTAELERLGGKVHRAASPAEAAAVAVQILSEAGVSGTVVRWENPLLDAMGIDSALAEAGLQAAVCRPGTARAEWLALAEQASAGITACDAAIAESGTVVLSTAPGRGRVTSLLPRLHIVVLRRSQLVYSFVPVFARLQAGPMPSQAVFATGPSRSADIEGDLSVGVHGPGRVHVILVASVD